VLLTTGTDFSGIGLTTSGYTAPPHRASIARSPITAGVHRRQKVLVICLNSSGTFTENHSSRLHRADPRCGAGPAGGPRLASCSPRPLAARSLVSSRGRAAGLGLPRWRPDSAVSPGWPIDSDPRT